MVKGTQMHDTKYVSSNNQDLSVYSSKKYKIKFCVPYI